MFASKHAVGGYASSGISRFCDGTVEACWLATVIVVPIFHNPYAWRGFQFNKEALLCLFALVSLAAMIVSATERRSLSPAQREDSGSWKKLGPLLACLSALALAYLGATCFSVYPYISLWGSDQHRQGTFEILCEMVLLGSVLFGLRNEVQVERLVTAVLLASLPVSIYAIMQRTGLEPPSSPVVDPSERISSLLGNAIYLAAYLIMTMPLALWRLMRLASSFDFWPLKLSLKATAFCFYGSLLLIQFTAFLCAGSRGPLVGLFACIAYLVVGLAVHGNKKRFLVAGAGLGAGLALLLLLLNFYHSTAETMLAKVGLERFAEILPLGHETDNFRTAMWSQASKLMLASATLPYPDGRHDELHALRPLLGYGPDTLSNVLPHQYWWPAIDPPLENRFHNLVWDMWFTVGIFGLFTFLAFVVLLFSQAYRQLGLLPQAWPSSLPWLALLLFGAAGCGAFYLWRGPGYIGLGLVTGLVTGLVALLLPNFFLQKDPPSGIVASSNASLVIVLLSALAGHLIETSFAYQTPATSALFWIYAGLIAVLASGLVLTKTVEKTEASPKDRKNRQKSQRALSQSKGPSVGTGWLWGGLCSALVMISLLFGFLSTYPTSDVSITDVLTTTLLQTKQEHAPSYVIWILLGPTWIASSFGFALDPFLRQKGRGFDGAFGKILLLAGAVAVGYAVLSAAQISAIGPFPDVSAPSASALRQGTGYQLLYLVYILLVLALIGWGARLLPTPTLAAAPWPRRSLVVLSVAFVLALGAAWITCINPVRADLLGKWAYGLEQEGRTSQSVDVFHEAVALAPGDTEYRRRLSDALMTMTTKALTRDEVDSLLTESERQLQEVKKRTSGLDPADYQLATLYLQWASIEPQPAKRLELAQKAREALDQALVFEPAYEAIWTDRAAVDSIFLNDPKDAQSSLRKAQNLTLGLSLLDWGDLYRDRVMVASNPALKEFYAHHALDLYHRDIQEDGPDKARAAAGHLAAGTLYLALKDRDRATSECQQALTTAVGDEIWRTDSTLAQIYGESGNRDEALVWLAKAIDAAPPEQQTALRSIQASLQ